MAKALALISGGLDSALAMALVKRQGIDVYALHFRHVFQPYSGGSPAYETARSVGVEPNFFDFTPVMLSYLKKPSHGYGRNLNPCIDCRIHQLRVARRVMKEQGCDFIVTGEVIGQRPMSQREDAIGLIEREAGVEGIVLRPLCALHLPETGPEKAGLVERAGLLGLRGRVRRPQLDLAKELGVTGFSSPAGGCLLTDPGFSLRLRDLLEHASGELDANDVELLKCGRHFRLGPATKFVVGRNEKDNERIMGLARPGDVVVRAAEGSSPDTVIRGDIGEEDIYKAAEITARYSRWRQQDKVAMVAVRPPSEEVWRFIEVAPADEIVAAKFAVAPPRPFG